MIPTSPAQPGPQPAVIQLFADIRCSRSDRTNSVRRHCCPHSRVAGPSGGRLRRTSRAEPAGGAPADAPAPAPPPTPGRPMGGTTITGNAMGTAPTGAAARRYPHRRRAQPVLRADRAASAVSSSGSCMSGTDGGLKRGSCSIAPPPPPPVLCGGFGWGLPGGSVGLVGRGTGGRLRRRGSVFVGDGSRLRCDPPVPARILALPAVAPAGVAAPCRRLRCLLVVAVAEAERATDDVADRVVARAVVRAVVSGPGLGRQARSRRRHQP